MSVRVIDGSMIYIGPFELEQMPSSCRLLMFECSGAMFIRDPELGPPDRN